MCMQQGIYPTTKYRHTNNKLKAQHYINLFSIVIVCENSKVPCITFLALIILLICLISINMPLRLLLSTDTVAEVISVADEPFCC